MEHRSSAQPPPLPEAHTPAGVPSRSGLDALLVRGPDRRTLAGLAAAVFACLLCMFCSFLLLPRNGASPAPSPAPVALNVETPSPTPTETPTPAGAGDAAPAGDANSTPASGETPAPSETHTPTATPTPTYTQTPAPTPTATDTPTGTATPTAPPSPTVTPRPTPTFTPTATPTPTPAITFGVNPSQIAKGMCATLSWNVDNVLAVLLLGGQFGDEPGQGVAGQGSLAVCPATTTTYYLRVRTANGTLDNAALLQVAVPTATVAPATPAPPAPTRVPIKLIDFVSEASSASTSFQNSSGYGIPVGGDPIYAGGFVALLNSSATLENGSHPALALETRPPVNPYTWLQGVYNRPLTLQLHDRLRMTVGYLQGSAATSISFQVLFAGSSIAQINHGYTGSLASLVQEVPAYATGAPGVFSIRVVMGNSKELEQVVWLVAQVERP